MKRLEVLRQLVGTAEGLRIADGVVISLASTRSIDRAEVASKNREVADLGLLYVEMVRAELFLRDTDHELVQAALDSAAELAEGAD
jgi:hypothetical protein